MNKTVIIYFSSHHMNTEKIVNGMKEKVEADIIKLPAQKKIDFSSYDNIIFASGIYHAKPAEEIMGIIDSLNVKEMKNKNGFFFLTSGSNNKKYLKDVLYLLERKGFMKVKGFSVKGYDTYGIFKLFGGISKNHPNQSEIEKCISVFKND